MAQVVGFHVEAFRHAFLPRNPEFRKVWLLSEAGEKLEDLEDLLIVFEQRKHEVARELHAIAERSLGEAFRQDMVPA